MSLIWSLDSISISSTVDLVLRVLFETVQIPQKLVELQLGNVIMKILLVLRRKGAAGSVVDQKLEQQQPSFSIGMVLCRTCFPYFRNKKNSVVMNLLL